MNEESQNSENKSSQVQIDDVLQGNFNVNTQGELYTTNAGGSALTSHEVCAILDFLEQNYHNQGTEYGKERKNKWDAFCDLVQKVHGYK